MLKISLFNLMKFHESMSSTHNFVMIPAEKVQMHDEEPILRAMQLIDSTDAKIALVVNSNGKMLGSVTDGDVRRALIAGCSLESPVRMAMHANPCIMPATSSRQDIIHGMQQLQVKQMPLLKSDGCVVGVVTYDALTGFLRIPRSNAVLIMAGGKGKRLLPITNDIPKPMIEVSGKPILEHILLQFIQQGFSRFYFAVNYLSHVIENYFGNGSHWNCTIEYLHEEEFLGTAGALSLFSSPPSDPFIVINGDILTSVDFSDLLDYHLSSDAIATICVRYHRTQVPYGVIRLKHGKLESIVEKPVHEDLISAGIYALHPEVLNYVPKEVPMDMPGLLMKLTQQAKNIAIYPMREDWLDIGRHDDLAIAQQTLAAKSSL
jgi:dTDP-glucose pyrophosphorylase/CBS domain-containing protein